MIKRFGMFAAGVLFGTAGLKILGSKDARKVYAHTTAAVLRAKDSVMKTINAVQEGAQDVYADAQDINEGRAQKEAEAIIEDAAEQPATEEAPAEETPVVTEE